MYIVCIQNSPHHIYPVSELDHNPRCLKVFGPVSEFLGRKFSHSIPWWSKGESFHPYCRACYRSFPQLITSLPPGLRMNVGSHLILINMIYGSRFSIWNRRRRLFAQCAQTSLCCISHDGAILTFQALSWIRLPLRFGRFSGRVIGGRAFEFWKINQEKMPDRLTEPYCTPCCMDALIP
jgi:hypothetical protein